MDENPYKAPQEQGQPGQPGWEDNLYWLMWLELTLFTAVAILLLVFLV
jgi:hypothetical protein